MYNCFLFDSTISSSTSIDPIDVALYNTTIQKLISSSIFLTTKSTLLLDGCIITSSTHDLPVIAAALRYATYAQVTLQNITITQGANIVALKSLDS